MSKSTRERLPSRHFEKIKSYKRKTSKGFTKPAQKHNNPLLEDYEKENEDEEL